jgi:hypothetical protein
MIRKLRNASRSARPSSTRRARPQCVGKRAYLFLWLPTAGCEPANHLYARCEVCTPHGFLRFPSAIRRFTRPMAPVLIPCEQRWDATSERGPCHSTDAIKRPVAKAPDKRHSFGRASPNISYRNRASYGGAGGQYAHAKVESNQLTLVSKLDAGRPKPPSCYT